MRALKYDELVKWCKESLADVITGTPEHLFYTNPNVFGCRIDLPPDPMQAVAFVYALLALEQNSTFYGALMWFTNWGAGTPQIEQCGLRILEQMRRGYGIVDSVENSPAHLFRSDEMIDAQAFATLALLWGWDAYFLPHGLRYFAYIRENSRVYLVSDEEKTLAYLLDGLSAYKPVIDTPRYIRENHTRV